MGPLAGAVYLLRALIALITSARLFFLALLPAAVALALSLAGVALSAYYGDDLLGYLWPRGGEASWLRASLEASSALLLAALSVLIMPWAVVLVGLPLCEPLAAALHDKLGGAEVDLGFFESVRSGLSMSLRVLAMALSGAIVLFFVSLLPVVGWVVAPIGALVWAPFCLCLDLCDPTQTRLNLTFRQRTQQLRGDLLATVSVGLIATLLVSIPFLNLLGLPLAVLMGTYHAHALSLKAHPRRA